MNPRQTPDLGPADPDPPLQVGRYLTVTEAGTIRVRAGKVELGQGISATLRGIVAAGMHLPLDHVELDEISTAHSPDEGFTAGSMSVQTTGARLAAASARMREAILEHVATTEGVERADVRVDQGRVLAAGRALSLAEAAAGLDLDSLVVTGQQLAEVWQTLPQLESGARLDLPDKVTGRFRFIQDLVFPDMLHARVARSARPSVRESDVLQAIAIDDLVAVVRWGGTVAVVARTEHGAVAAAAQAQERLARNGTSSRPPVPRRGPDDPVADLVSRPARSRELLLDQATERAQEIASDSLTATYERGYLAHASLGPSCAVARFEDGRLEVWSHTQGVFPLRRDLSLSLGLPETRITVHHAPGAGCYGHNPADDVALEAALVAVRVPGRPVRLIWSRADELTRGPFGPPMTVTLAAHLDDSGLPDSWTQRVRSGGHNGRPGRGRRSSLQAELDLGRRPLPATEPPLEVGGGASRNAVPCYDLPRRDIRLDFVQDGLARTSSLRSLGAHVNVFAIESFVDEIALRSGQDPVQLRRRLLSDRRARQVLDVATERAGWGRAASSQAQGIGLARYKNAGGYCAVVADVSVDVELEVHRLTVAVDVGRVVDLDAMVNQVEGGAIQATSWTLHESVSFAQGVVTSDSWERYPVIRFSDAPRVGVEVVDRPDCPAVGAGELTMGPTAAAIANALSAALGVRVRRLPLHRAAILDAIERAP